MRILLKENGQRRLINSNFRHNNYYVTRIVTAVLRIIYIHSPPVLANDERADFDLSPSRKLQAMTNIIHMYLTAKLFFHELRFVVV